jgi:hypothetical protein
VDSFATRRPHPVRLHRTLRLHEVDLHRRIGCLHYEGCLKRAAQHTWLSFTCVRCFAFRPREVEPDGSWSLEDSIRYLAAGLANRAFSSVELWLETQPSPGRTQL